MSGCFNWTMAHERIPCAVTSNSASLRLIWAQSSTKVNHILTSYQDKCAIAKASESENVFYSSEMKTQRSAPNVWREIKYQCQTDANLKLTKQSCNFVGFLLLNLFIIQGFKEDVQDQDVFSEERTDPCASETSMTGVLKHHVLPVFSIIVTLKVNDGDPEHAALQPSTHREREEAYIWRADTAEPYSPNILFSFVEFLSQIFSRGLTGDLNHGQLLAIASHVAGGLTHTVIVVFLYQKVCEWSELFKNNVITARESNKPDTEALTFLPKITLHTTGKGVKKKEKRCHRSLSMKASNDGKEERKLCGIYLISVEHRHVTNPPNGIFKQSFYCIILLQLSWKQFQVNVTFEWILPRMGCLSYSNFKSHSSVLIVFLLFIYLFFPAV